MEGLARAVLNCLIVGDSDPRHVNATDLRLGAHQRIHTALLAGATDLPLLSAACPHDKEELLLIMETVASGKNLDSYLTALRRENQLVDIRKAALEAAANPERGDAIAAKMRELSALKSARGPRHVSEGLADLLNTGKAPSVPLGISSLEGIIQIEPGHLATIGARPGVGKTAMLTTISLAASRKNWQVLFFSLEMSEKEIRQRMIASISGCSLDQVKTAEDERLVSAMSEFNKLPIWISADMDTRQEKLHTHLCSVIERFAYLNADRPTVVVIDYLQVVKPDSQYRNRVEAVGEMIQDFKGCAKRAGVPIIVGAQLNRQADMRATGKPQLSDLRESGEIEQVSDQIVLIHRDLFTEPEKALVGVQKNRHGITGQARARYDGPTCTFGDEYF